MIASLQRCDSIYFHFSGYSMSANWRAKIRVLAISCQKNYPLIRGSANWVSAFWKLFYESLTRKRPGKMNLSANQRCPPFRVSDNQRFYCIFVHVSSLGLKKDIVDLTANSASNVHTFTLKSFWFNDHAVWKTHHT